MRYLLFATLLATVTAFGQTNHVRLSAKITNPNSDSLVIHNTGFKTTLKGKNGTFSANLDAPSGFYQLFDGAQFAMLYLQKGRDLSLAADGKRLRETISFSGNGAPENDFLLWKFKEDQKFKNSFGNQLPDDATLQATLEKRRSDAKAKLASGNCHPEFPGLMLAEYENEDARIIMDLAQVRTKTNGLDALKNTAAPDFSFENHKCGKSTLASLKGKILYIDIWATWCAPCSAEIPYLKKLEEQSKGQAVEFVSISIDELKNHEKWKKFVTDNQLKGVQLLSDGAWQSS